MPFLPPTPTFLPVSRWNRGEIALSSASTSRNSSVVSYEGNDHIETLEQDTIYRYTDVESHHPDRGQPSFSSSSNLWSAPSFNTGEKEKVEDGKEYTDSSTIPISPLISNSSHDRYQQRRQSLSEIFTSVGTGPLAVVLLITSSGKRRMTCLVFAATGIFILILLLGKHHSFVDVDLLSGYRFQLGRTSGTPTNQHYMNAQGYYGELRKLSTKGSQKPRVMIRKILSSEGIGSALQHFKESVIISEAIDSTLLFVESESEHGYTTSQILNSGYGTLPVKPNVICELSNYLKREDREKFVNDYCSKPVDHIVNTALDVGEKMKHCDVVLDDMWDELHEDYNGCIRDWVRDRLGASQWRRKRNQSYGGWGLKSSKPEPLKIVIHIRWGDSPTDGTYFRGSMSIDNINRILSDVNKLSIGDQQTEVKIVMENHDSKAGPNQISGEEILSKLNPWGEDGKKRGGGRDMIKSVEIIDTGDAIADMKHMADNDLLLIGGSSYAVIAHLLSPAGLTIVDGGDVAGKYRNTSSTDRSVVLMQDYRVEHLEQYLAYSEPLQ